MRTVVLPLAQFGKKCRISRAIIDKRCRITDHTFIGEDHAEDAKRYTLTEDGIVLVCPHMLGQENP